MACQKDAYAKERKALCEILRMKGITNADVLRAIEEVPRHCFVPADLKNYAYEDRPLPIGFGQTISQPYIVAAMIESIKPNKNHRVLEIGAGSGYAASVLSCIAGEVYAVEHIEGLFRQAKERIESLGYGNIRLFCRDGSKGLPEHSPYDGIMVSAAAPQVPKELLEQLKEGGCMVIPIGVSDQKLVRIKRMKDGYAAETLMDVIFVPLACGKT